MNSVLKKYWWLILLAIFVLILKFFPDKLPFLEKIDKSKPTVSSSNSTGQHWRDFKDNDTYVGDKNWLYTSVTPVKYKVETYKEFVVDGDALDPKVSPDGSKIAFVVKVEGRTNLAIADLLSNTVKPLDIKFDTISHPSWDSEGAKIVFSGTIGNTSEIYTYDIDKKKLFQVTYDSSRKKDWPRFSPYKFGQHYRIAYSSEERGRKDIWWVRANGEEDMPVTFSAESLAKYNNPKEWGDAGVPQNLPKTGGNFPEWSPSGFMIIYKTDKTIYNTISYSYGEWWKPSTLSIPASNGILEWAPNQYSLLEYVPTQHIANRVPVGTGTKQQILRDKNLTSVPSYFPNGKAFAYTHLSKGKSILAAEPYNDPLGDVSNLWMYQYNDIQQNKIAKNQMLLLHSSNERIYKIYETEFYYCGGPDETGHARPYLVTSDAVLETFYATFTALLGFMERAEFVQSLAEFATNGYDIAKTKNAPAEIQNFFLTGLILLNPDAVKSPPAAVKEEVSRIQRASGIADSMFGQKISYDDFLVRGKYERDKDLQRYFQALKWFQIFRFDLTKESDRKWVAALQEVLNESSVSRPLERIILALKDNMGESRYYGPMTLTKMAADGKLPEVKSSLPWLQVEDSFKIFPSIYTLDSFIFDELITHTKRADTVGTVDNPRLLPMGMDVMAALGSIEAKKILLEEFKESRFVNYEKKLENVTKKIASFPPTIWDSNLYHVWLGILDALIHFPANAPDFAHTQAWKRKELNAALGSWVNLRYETVAYVHGSAPECGEAGYEQVIIGMPKGYVEPNPEFFKHMNNGFDKIRQRFNLLVTDKELRAAIEERIGKFQSHLTVLEQIARKELINEPITDKEYNEILYIGRIIEHFILLMNSISPYQDEDNGALSNPDSIEKIVYVQTTPFGEKLYEGIGPVNEINVIVPFFGRRQIVKGPVYSYYEFRSQEIWKNDRWRNEFDKKKGLPVWIKDYYEGTETRSLPDM